MIKLVVRAEGHRLEQIVNHIPVLFPNLRGLPGVLVNLIELA